MKGKRGSILAFLLALFLISTPVWAATITVNTTVDEDNSGGDCSVREALGSIDDGRDFGGCTASGAYGSADTVVLQSGATYLLTEGSLEASVDVIIDGQGATVDGGGNYRVFYLCRLDDCGATVTINNLTITKGSAPEGGGIYNLGTTLILNSSTISDNDSAVGGGIYNDGGTLTLNDSTIGGSGTPNAAMFGGGIYNWSGTVTLNSSTINNNTAEENGGGIHNANAGVVTLNSSTINDNMADSDGGGIYNDDAGSDGDTVVLINNSAVNGNTANNEGGGIYNIDGTVDIINNSTVNGNTGGYGVGIYNSGTLTVTDSIVNGNTSDQSGGGIYNSSAGTVTLNSSTISGNTARSEGGSIYNYGTLNVNNSTVGPANTADYGGGIFNEGDLTLTNSTVSGNMANFDGGGISNPGGTVTITNSTVGPANEANAGGGIYNDSTLNVNNSTISGNTANNGGGIYQNADSASLNNVTITNNSSTEYSGGGIHISAGSFDVYQSIIAGNTDNSGANRHDCDGIIASIGYNLIQDDNGCSGMVDRDITGDDPMLGDLADNGGPTFTHALQDGSPAIDAGAKCPVTDQRGVTRPLDGNGDGDPVCDIGAYEYGNDFPSAPVLVSPADGATVQGPDVTVQWNFATDPDGDSLTYTLTVCEDELFSEGCLSLKPMAAAEKVIWYANVGGLFGGIVLIGAVFAGGIGPVRRHKFMMLFVGLMVAGLISSCGGGGGGASPTPTPPPPASYMSQEVAGLTAGTTYYWKITADDGKGGITESAPRSFTTG